MGGLEMVNADFSGHVFFFWRYSSASAVAVFGALRHCKSDLLFLEACLESTFFRFCALCDSLR